MVRGSAAGRPQAEPAQACASSQQPPSNRGGPWGRFPVQVSITAPPASTSPTSPPQSRGLAEPGLGQKHSQGQKRGPGQLHGQAQMQFLPRLESCRFPAGEQKPETGTGRRRERALLSPRGCLDKCTALLQHPSPSQAPGLAARRPVMPRAPLWSRSQTPLLGRGAEMLQETGTPRPSTATPCHPTGHGLHPR